MKNGHKTNGAVKLQPRDEFVKKHSPIILSALLMRRDSMTSNERVDLAIETAGQIYSSVTTEERRDYLLENIPTVLSALLVRRASTHPRDLIMPAINTVGRIYDVIHELDVPAEAMTSQPIPLRDTPTPQIGNHSLKC